MEQKTGEVKNRRKARFVAEQEGSRTAQQPNCERGDDGRGSVESEQDQRRAGDLIIRIHESSWFRILITATIILDTVFRAMHSYEVLRHYLHQLYVFETALVTGMYSLEYLINVWAEGFHFLWSKSGAFDALVLCAVYLSVFSPENTTPMTVELRAVRLLKILSFFPALRDMAECFFRVAKKAVYAFFLLLLFIFFFGVCGYYFYGGPDSPDPLNWGDKSSSFSTAAVLVTLDGWTDIQEVLDNAGMKSSRIFTILCIVLGHFILYNAFTAVMCADMTLISKEQEVTQEKMEEHARALRRKARRPVQEEEIRQIRGDFQRLMEEFKTRPKNKKVREGPFSSINFAKLFLTSLRHLDDEMKEMTRHYDEMAKALRKLNEDEQLHEP